MLSSSPLPPPPNPEHTRTNVHMVSWADNERVKNKWVADIDAVIEALEKAEEQGNPLIYMVNSLST